MYERHNMGTGTKTYREMWNSAMGGREKKNK